MTETLTPEQIAADNARKALINRIKGLKANAADEGLHPDLRDSFEAKAAELIGKYEVNIAELTALSDEDQAKGIVLFTFEVSNAHKLGKLRCQALAEAAVKPFGGTSMLTDPRYADIPATLYVHIREDLKEVVEILLTSLAEQLDVLLAQAVKKHMKKWTERLEVLEDMTPTQAQRTQQALSYRRSWISSWGYRVGDRVSTSRADARKVAEQEAMAKAFAEGGEQAVAETASKLLPALRDDFKSAEEAKEAWYRAEFGKDVPKAKVSRWKHNSSGMVGGSQGARKTDIGQTRIEG